MKRCLYLGFRSLGFSEKLLRLADPRLRISCLALIPALVWTDPSSCVVTYFSLKICKYMYKNTIVKTVQVSVQISHFISTWMMLLWLTEAWMVSLLLQTGRDQDPQWLSTPLFGCKLPLREIFF